MKGVYENTDEASPFRRRPDFDLLHLKNGGGTSGVLVNYYTRDLDDPIPLPSY